MKYKLGAFKPRDAIILVDFLQKLRGCQVKSGNMYAGIRAKMVLRT